MILATRCASCGTVFRLAQDQYTASDGWVRCGRCDHVFNARDGLFDPESESPPAWPVDGPQAANPSAPDRLDLPVAQVADVAEVADSGDAISLDEIDAPPWRPGADAAALRPDPSAESSIGTTAPEFLRHAERPARWHTSRARRALGSAMLLLTAVLAAQVVHHFRDSIGARWPGVRPMLTAWCEGFGCRVEAPRRIDDLAVESTTLTRGSGADTFRLAVTLRNRGDLALALPSVDLSLTDSSGQLVLRRALAASAFEGASAPLQPGAESALHVLLSTGVSFTGYTVEIFYP